MNAAEESSDLHPFYFVWNDYLIPDSLDQYSGVKWRRHEDEPRYDYDCPVSNIFVEIIEGHGMPALLEEGFEETKSFIDENPRINLIIPHIRKLNGGYD